MHKYLNVQTTIHAQSLENTQLTLMEEWRGDVQLSLFGLLLLTQPLHSSEQHTRANLEFSSNFGPLKAHTTFQIKTSLV